MIDHTALEAAIAGAEPGELFEVAAQLQGKAIVALGSAPAPEEDHLLDMAEVAKALGVVEGQARDMGRRGELPIVMVGRYVRVRASSLREWMATRENGRLPHRRTD